jgi:hypothetical protein
MRSKKTMTKSDPKPTLELINNDGPGDPPIKKPSKFSLDRFKSTRAATIARVEKQLTGLPVMRISEADDFVRLHPTKWTGELCFVKVPIKGAPKDTVHLIVEEVAMMYLPSKQIIRHRLALATKPFDIFFLCIVPSQNLDNTFNANNLEGCEMAKDYWVVVTSRRNEGVDGYKLDKAPDQDLFPDPQWPTQSMEEILEATFNGGRIIETPDHPGLCRKRGIKPPQED